MNKEKLKQDMNFLEFPLWVQNEVEVSDGKDGYVWKDREGFLYRSAHRPPVRTDFLFLSWLLLQSQQAGWEEVVETTRYAILKGCEIQSGKWWRDRLTESLRRWETVRLEFQGSFYDGRTYRTLHFGVIDSWSIEEKTGKMQIRFSPQWLLRIKESHFFKFLDLKLIRSVHSPLGARLYEILIKNFQGREAWKIDAALLARKIPMSECYPAHIIPKIRTAVNEINEHTDFHVKLDVERERGKALLTFRKVEPIPVDTSAESSSDNQELADLLELVPAKHRDKPTIRELVRGALVKHGADYVKRNLQYAAAHSNGHYRAYLAKSLAADWGKGLEEDEQDRKAEQVAEQSSRQVEELERQRLQERARHIEELLDAMDEDARAVLRKRAVEKLPAAWRKHEKRIRTAMLGILDGETE